MPAHAGASRAGAVGVHGVHDFDRERGIAVDCRVDVRAASLVERVAHRRRVGGRWHAVHRGWGSAGLLRNLPFFSALREGRGGRSEGEDCRRRRRERRGARHLRIQRARVGPARRPRGRATSRRCRRPREDRVTGRKRLRQGVQRAPRRPHDDGARGAPPSSRQKTRWIASAGIWIGSAQCVSPAGRRFRGHGRDCRISRRERCVSMANDTPPDVRRQGPRRHGLPSPRRPRQREIPLLQKAVVFGRLAPVQKQLG